MKTRTMRLLFITQKIHENDDDLAFTTLWVQEFIRQGVDVEVICLEKGDFTGSFPVYSLGKEEGFGKWKRVLRFYKKIFTSKYDAVFVHMNPEYVTLGGWWWLIQRTPIYLWYTHYTMHIHLFIAGLLCSKMFAATAQSLPQYEGNTKKVILGHGIDLDFWTTDEAPNKNSHKKILAVHRLSRSKRVELAIETVSLLPNEYTLDIYGRSIDDKYFKELNLLIKSLGLQERVRFLGPVPMKDLREVYKNYRLMINMAPDTIDKTMLEVMLYGIYPVTTPENSKSIGLPTSPSSELPKDLASFITSLDWQVYDTVFLKGIVKSKHSLQNLVKKILQNI